MSRFIGVMSALIVSIVSVTAGLASETPTRVTAALVNELRITLERNNVKAGLGALEGAVREGNLAVLLQLAEIYEDGEFVPEDQSKACKAYILATEYLGKIDRFHPQAKKLAIAYRNAADCHIRGVGTANGIPDLATAGNLLFHSGVILQDAESLFKLGKLFLSTDGIGPNLGMAIRFLENSARKQYPPAQALLGSMIWEGKIAKRQPTKGLALLILGKERTLPKDRAWITALHDEAMITASKEVEREARLLVEQWKAVHSQGNSTIVEVAPLNDGAVPTPSKSPTHKLNGDEEGLVKSVDGLTKATRETHRPASADAVPNE